MMVSARKTVGALNLLSDLEALDRTVVQYNQMADWYLKVRMKGIALELVL